MNLKRFVLVTVVWAIFLSPNGELAAGSCGIELLKGDFVKKMKFTPKDSSGFKNGEIILKGKDASVIINGIKTDNLNACYVIQVRFTADAGTRFISYIENSSNGWQNSIGRCRGTGKKQLLEYLFSIKKPVTRTSYVVVKNKKGGTIKLSSIKVIEIAKGTVTAGDLEANADFMAAYP